MRLPVGPRWQPIMLEDRILVAEQSLTWQPNWSCDLQLSTLALNGLDGWSERPDSINRLVMSALFQIFAKIWIRRRKTYIPFCPWVSNYLGNENPGTKLNCLPSAWVYWLCSPDVTRRMGFPVRHIPHVGTPWCVGSIVNETQTLFMAYENITQPKKIKRPLTESESEHETDENSYQFIVLESIEETSITKLSPFLIKKNNRNTL